MLLAAGEAAAADRTAVTGLDPTVLPETPGDSAQPAGEEEEAAGSPLGLETAAVGAGEQGQEGVEALNRDLGVPAAETAARSLVPAEGDHEAVGAAEEAAADPGEDEGEFLEEEHGGVE